MKYFSLTQYLAVIKKELRIYFNSPIAYIFLVALLGFSFWMFFRSFFLVGQMDLRNFFGLLPWTFLLLIPAMTMRLWSEESKQGTIETLLTSSIPLPVVVLAKFKASVIFLSIALVATFLLPISLMSVGNLDWGATIASYIGILLLGSAYLSLGQLISSLNKNQIVSFILTAIICFALFILSQPIVTYSLPSILVPFINFFSFGSHYESITRGVLDTRDVIYYLTFIALMLYTNAQVLYVRR